MEKSFDGGVNLYLRSVIFSRNRSILEEWIPIDYLAQIHSYFELDYSSRQKQKADGMESTTKVLALGKAVIVIFQEFSQMTICSRHNPHFGKTSLGLSLVP